MSLVVETPDTFGPEREYALGVVLGHFLGIEFSRTVGPAGVVRIRADDGRSLEMPDVLFDIEPAHWLTPRCVPTGPLARTRVEGSGLRPALTEPELPVVLGTAPPLVERSDELTLRLNLDVFGTAFFMLSGMEELVPYERDEHGRFPAVASLACREGLVDRPIVDEYVELMWACLEELWPGLDRKPAIFSVFSTHDVDTPFEYHRMRPGYLGRVIASRARSGNLREAPRVVAEWLAVKRRGIGADPWNTFDFIVDSAERAGWPCAFFLIPDPDPVGRDRRYQYSLEDPEIRDLIRTLGHRGAEIGVHPSYGAHLDGDRVRRESARLRDACRVLGVEQTHWGGRAHYLRWDRLASPRLWAEAGLRYDTTMGFAERPGFRCGVCRPFPFFDLTTRTELPLWERPLVLMDVSVTEAKYLGLAPESEEARQVVLDLRERCRRVGGEFVILWHNNALADPAHRDLYAAALSGK